MAHQAGRLVRREEILVLAGVLEQLLALHGNDEEDLLLATLDHLEGQEGTLTAMHQQHGELNTKFGALAQIKRLPELRKRFLQLLEAVDQHFQFEETRVFPLLERRLTPALLEKLGVTLAAQREAPPA
jgi:hemerythrin-like domain-containing protein